MLFDDTASGTSTVNVTDANVQPAVVVFNNFGKDYTIGGNPIAGTGSIIMSGTASVTLNNANTFSGGVFVNSGKLNFGNASAIGTGRLTLQSGATIDNTSGAALTETTNNPLTWNGDINFIGTNSLNLGTGPLTINAGASPANVGSTTINVAANTLTVGGAFTNPGGLGLFKTGLGNLAFNGGGTFAGASRISQGILTVGGGTLSFSSGAVPGLSAGFNTGESSSIFVNTGGTLNTTGELWLGAAANTYGSITVNGGIINAGTWLALGRGNPNLGGVGIVNINAGGTINQNGNAVATTIGSFGTPLGGGIGQLTVNPGGTLTTSGTNGVFAGENEPGTLNVLGNGTTQATVNIGNGGGFLGLSVARNGQDPFGVVNLGAIGGTTTNNGIITTPAALGGAGTGIFNFHGGTLRQQLQRKFHEPICARLHLRRRRDHRYQWLESDHPAEVGAPFRQWRNGDGSDRERHRLCRYSLRAN